MWTERTGVNGSTAGLIARLALLAAAIAFFLAASGVMSAEFQPSARIVMVTAITGLLAPFFRPDATGHACRSAVPVALWCIGAVVIAAGAIAVTGGPGVSAPRVLRASLLLLLVLLATHAAAAVIEEALLALTRDREGVHEAATWVVVVALAAFGATPLWLGPVAELLSGSEPAAVDAIVGMSPLTHLAVASDNDLLRNQWLYQHSNLASLRVTYPTLVAIILSYLAAILALSTVLTALAIHRSRSGRASWTDPSTEIAP